MYNLHLTAEQLEFRETLRDFVEREVKPVAVHPGRLEPFDKPLLKNLLDQASEIGLRTLCLSEESGGSGADTLTLCIVLEEIAAGDVDLAVALGQTAVLGRALFGELMTQEQRKHCGKQFTEDSQYHLAFAGRDPSADIGWSYHRPLAEEPGTEPVALRKGNEWLINGKLAFVSNAPIAKLIVVQARTDPKKTGMYGVSTLLVPRDAPGLTVGAAIGPFASSGKQIKWRHGTGAEVVFKDCRIPAANLVGSEGQTPLATAAQVARGAAALAAINIGVGRAAFEAAVDYAKMRRQGGRNIVEHQSIGGKLADIATKLEVARNMVWKAAWVADHPEAIADRSVSDLPLHVIARNFTAEAVHRATLEAAECFGAMGVMRDMPLQKYVHDTLMLLHYGDNDSASGLQIAEAIAGYGRAA